MPTLTPSIATFILFRHLMMALRFGLTVTILWQQLTAKLWLHKPNINKAIDNHYCLQTRIIPIKYRPSLLLWF